MTKHRKTQRRRQKGGFWPFTSSEPSDPYAQKRTWGQWFSGATGSAENTLTNIGNSISSGTTNMVNSANNFMKSDVNFTGSQQPSQQPIQQQQYPNQQAYGGKRRRHSRRMKGGKGGLGLTYYAAPVSGLKVAEPDSWQYYANGINQYSAKGGSRKNKTRKTRRHRK
jgi:hypothetical protein